MKIIKSFFLITPVALVACSTTYYNPNIKDHQTLDRQRIIDEGLCTRVAAGSVPMPEIRQYPSTNSNFNVTGKLQTRYPNGQTLNSTYNSTIYSYPNVGEAFSSGLANGANVGLALRAQIEKNKVFKGCMYNLGWTTERPQSNKKYISELKHLSDQGNSEASFSLSKIYAEEKDNQLMLSYLQKAANQGNSQAQVILAINYIEGKIVPKDVNKSVELLKQSCQQNNTMGCVGIGTLFYTGQGVKQNFSIAYILFNKAYNLGNLEALAFIEKVKPKLSKEELEQAKLAKDVIY
ncbi:tetratricopeptide repeat protein [Acinetobacter haemolyticus]|uniref:tetratricopeptide repeat protein n=1 Tax=Acinetobacter haemolyticus TaxID=29430 RepID=UPI000F73C750|nr:tetratricopeptide repeat protein [Acinetobacter haemolyticus]NCU23651.1 sel1 repeat family protein [Acinetobacter haemolyticus]RSN75175.1 sel1 repeat family protein [Acinetobacter haemolyticus]